MWLRFSCVSFFFMFVFSFSQLVRQSINYEFIHWNWFSKRTFFFCSNVLLFFVTFGLPFSPESSDFDEDRVIWWEVELLLLIIIESSSTRGLLVTTVAVLFVRFFVWCDDADLSAAPWARTVFALQISQFFANDSWCCGLCGRVCAFVYFVINEKI